MTKDQKINWGLAGATIVAFLVGWRRVAGALLAGTAVYDYNRRKPKTAAAEGVAGALFLLMPDWPESIAGALKPAQTIVVTTPGKQTNPAAVPVGLKQSIFDADLGGGWTMLDARDSRVRQFDTDADVHVGQIASLLLSPGPTSPVKVFNAQIINKTGDDFSGKWVGGAPSGGPQMIDFRGANIFDFHG